MEHEVLSLQLFSDFFIFVFCDAVCGKTTKLKNINFHISGDLRHSGNLKEFVEEHRGKRLMVIGGGETASDIMDEW